MAPVPPNARLEVEVRRLHAEGLSDAQIARRVGRPRTTVWRVRRRLELPSNSPPNYRKAPRRLDAEAARRLHARGLIDREIAGKLGVSRETVSRWRRLEHLPRNAKPGRKPRD